MSKSLQDLCPGIRPQAARFLRRAAEELHFSMSVRDTLRTPEEQAANLAKGVSFTARSKHLPQPGCRQSHALDVAPRHLMALKLWAPEHPDWLRLGELGESEGLRWGGRWAGKFHRPNDPTSRWPDCPHFDVQVIHPAAVRLSLTALSKVEWADKKLKAAA